MTATSNQQKKLCDGETSIYNVDASFGVCSTIDSYSGYVLSTCMLSCPTSSLPAQYMQTPHHKVYITSSQTINMETVPSNSSSRITLRNKSDCTLQLSNTRWDKHGVLWLCSLIQWLKDWWHATAVTIHKPEAKFLVYMVISKRQRTAWSVRISSSVPQVLHTTYNSRWTIFHLCQKSYTDIHVCINW